MSRQNIIIAACCIVVIALVIWLVSPNHEEQAKSQLEAAYKVEQSGQFDQAIALYQTLIKEYDGTAAADLAVQSIARVETYKERKAIQEVQKNLGRVQLVLNGYREMTGKTPRSISDLDDERYMFDSDYVVGIVPEGFTYYLRFEKTGGYTLYSHKEGAEKVVKRYDSNKADVIELSAFENEINAEGYVRSERQRFVFLEPSS